MSSSNVPDARDFSDSFGFGVRTVSLKYPTSEVELRGLRINILSGYSIVEFNYRDSWLSNQIFEGLRCVGAVCMLDDPGTCTLFVAGTSRSNIDYPDYGSSFRLIIRTLEARCMVPHSSRWAASIIDQAYVVDGTVHLIHQGTAHRAYYHNGTACSRAVRESGYQEGTPEFEMFMCLGGYDV